MKRVERWKEQMPTEAEMRPKDKYTVFDRKVKRYRKGIHSKCHTDFYSGGHITGKELYHRVVDILSEWKLTISQRFPNGRESAKGLTHLVSRWMTTAQTCAAEPYQM